MDEKSYFLYTFHLFIEQETMNYRGYLRQITNNGFMIMHTTQMSVTIYTPELAVLLTSKELKASILHTDIKTTICGMDYIKSYTKGYKNGIAYFNENYFVSNKYSVNARLYTENIKELYLKTGYNEKMNQGWEYVTRAYPTIINHEIIEEFGYYSGIVNEVFELERKHPKLFSYFDSDEDSNYSQKEKREKPKPNGKLIIFKNSEIIDKIHYELKGYFPNKEAELLKALQGEQLSEILLFPHNQNKFVEVFRRLKYNGFLLNADTETKNWICKNFQFVKKGFAEPQPFNESSVWDNLNKGKGEPTKKERICNTEWLPYKSPSQLIKETKNEKQ